MDAITHTLLTYRWWILVPLSFWESTVIAFVAGMLAAAGYFNIYALSAYFFFRDIVLDLVYYSLGRFAGRTRFAWRMLAKLHVSEDSLAAVRDMWNRRPARTMLVGKLSYGIAMSFVIAAGTVGMSLRSFVMYGAMAAVLQYGVLLFLGYFFGASTGGSLITIIQNIQYVLAGGAAVLIAYYGITLYMRGRMLREDEQLEHSSNINEITESKKNE